MSIYVHANSMKNIHARVCLLCNSKPDEGTVIGGNIHIEDSMGAPRISQGACVENDSFNKYL